MKKGQKINMRKYINHWRIWLKRTIIDLYAPNISAPNFIKHTLKDLKAHTDSNVVVVRDFSTLLSPIDRSSKQKINKETLELNETIEQMDLTGVYRTFHLTSA
jgi:hypothetical protein